MPHIRLKELSIDFPVFNSRSRGLINSLFHYAQKEQGRIEAAGLKGFLVHALREIDLTLNSGDRIALIGKNGAGKTTLLRVFSGAYEPTYGSAEIEGTVSSLTDISLGMDMESTGYENIILKSIVMGKTRREAIASTPEIEAFTELGPYLNLPVRTYSTGMMLRLAFAISTNYIPDILIMDEMIGASDAAFLSKTKARIEDLIEQVPILALASHNENILKDFCNTAILLDGGKILYAGSVDECLKEYDKTK